MTTTPNAIGESDEEKPLKQLPNTLNADALDEITNLVYIHGSNSLKVDWLAIKQVIANSPPPPPPPRPPISVAINFVDKALSRITNLSREEFERGTSPIPPPPPRPPISVTINVDYDSY